MENINLFNNKSLRPNYSDEALMTLLVRGEETAFVELIQRFQNDVFRFCFHYLRDVELAKEAVQEVFLRLYIAKDRFDTNKKLKPWLFCIARNLCLNEIKRQKLVWFESFDDNIDKNHKEKEETQNEFQPARNETPFEKLIVKEKHRMLWNAINELPDEARELVVLRYFEKLQVRDIAEILGTTEGAVRTRLHRILRYLKDKLNEQLEFHE